MHDRDEERRLLESEIERRLAELFAELRDEFERLRLESDGRWAGFTSRFEQRIAGIVPEELLPAREEPSERGQLSIAAVRELDGAATQVEILHRLLEACRRQASRAILLVLKNGAWAVWKASGFAGGGSAQGAVRRTGRRRGGCLSGWCPRDGWRGWWPALAPGWPPPTRFRRASPARTRRTRS